MFQRGRRWLADVFRDGAKHSLHLDAAEAQDPSTEADDFIADPFKVGLRNSAIALIAIGGVGLGYLLKIWLHEGSTLRIAWWMWAAFAVYTVAICCLHAFLGSIVGGRRAANALKVVLVLTGLGMFAAVHYHFNIARG